MGQKRWVGPGPGGDEETFKKEEAGRIWGWFWGMQCLTPSLLRKHSVGFLVPLPNPGCCKEETVPELISLAKTVLKEFL